jgi:hypothetical protein
VAASSAITVYVGDAHREVVTMTPALNVAGWTMRVRVWNSFGQLTLTKSFTWSDTGSGIGYWDLTSADTSGLPAGAYWRAVERVDAGAEDTISCGPVTVLGKPPLPLE